MIEGALAELKTVHAAKDIVGIDSALEKLNAGWQAASQDMYNATNQKQDDANANQNTDNQQQNTNQKDGENVTDVDFEEVK